MENAGDYLVDTDLHRIPNVHGAAASTAVLFVHGFTGDGIKTWGEFPSRLREDPELADADFFFWQYPTKLNPAEFILGKVWSEDPAIELIGKGLRSLVEDRLGGYERLMLVAHSMGGLVVQSFVLEEIERGTSDTLDRITEIVMYATPSGGLESARRFGFLKRQVGDMSIVGPFIEALRSGWQTQVDDRRADDDRPYRFRLTLVAGNRDKFVPEESSLGPFPLDEHEVVPGNHVELVKPEKSGERTYAVLKTRLLRGTPTGEELRVVNGQSQEAVDTMAKIRAAALLGQAEELIKLAGALASGDVRLPTVERALALELSGFREHDDAVLLFDRYLDFSLADGSQPSKDDAYAVQQLAVSLSALGRNHDAIARMEELPADIRATSETMGIRAGRLKREWLENRGNIVVGNRAFQTYRAAFNNARELEDADQMIYNGINTAFMSLMLDLPHVGLAEELLDLTTARPDPDYWTHATQAEALLLLERFAEAQTQYATAFTEADTPRYLATTAAQAINILDKLGNPPEAAGVRALIDEFFPDLQLAVEAQEAASEEKELAR